MSVFYLGSSKETPEQGTARVDKGQDLKLAQMQKADQDIANLQDAVEMP